MANPDHVQWIEEGVPAWNQRRQANPFVPDFSATRGASPLHGKELKGANFDKANFSGSGQFEVDFADAILTNTNFQSCVLSGSGFLRADLSGADFTDAYLAGDDRHIVNGSPYHLKPVTLQDATITNAIFSNAHLAGVDFGGTQPSSAVLFPEVELPKQQFVLETEIHGIDQLLDVVRRLKAVYDAEQPALDITLYFRGEPKQRDADGDWALSPSVKRGGFHSYESQMLVDLMSLHPEEFAAEQSALSKWVFAQHHLLKTRFLDVTKNPLVALFFASEMYKQDPGKFHIFAVPRKLIKPFDSDTISIVSNFGRLPHREQQMLLGNREGDVRIGHDYSSVMEKLYQLIQEEKPGFVQRIELPDLFGVYIVEPEYSSDRIRAQAGAMLTSAHHDRFERTYVEKAVNVNVYGHYTFSIPPGEHKPQLLDDLRLLNITRQSLLPGLDESSREITHRYTGQI